MWPYSYHPDACAENNEELEGLAIDAVLALEVIISLSAYSTKSTWMPDMHGPNGQNVTILRVTRFFVDI